MHKDFIVIKSSPVKRSIHDIRLKQKNHQLPDGFYYINQLFKIKKRLHFQQELLMPGCRLPHLRFH